MQHDEAAHAMRFVMNPAAQFELLLFLLAIAIVLELIARRLRMPPAAALILGGIVLALIPSVPEVTLDPDLALVLFLPPLLLGSAYFTVWRDFRANLRIILQLAVGAVAFTTAVVGVVAHAVQPGLPWAACFALGAIVSPPDAVAAKAVLNRVKLPPRMMVLLEGESLVNDATGLVLFRFAVAAGLTGAFSVGEAAGSFAVLSIGGVLAGMAFGWLTMLILGRLEDPHLVAIGSFLAAWTSYIGGEALHVSGVLSTVACGLVMGIRQHKVLAAEARIEARAVWRMMEFVLESFVFILIGTSLQHILQRLAHGGASLWALVIPCAAIVAAVVLSRAMWIFPATYLPRWLIPALRRTDPVPPISVPIIMSWAGMRGVVSLAAALSLPAAFPGRDFILATTFLVIFVTVLVQGATLAPLIRLLRLSEFTLHERDTISVDQARAFMAAAQLRAVEEQARQGEVTRHPRLLEQYGYRANASARFAASAGALHEDRTEHFRVVLAAVTAGRQEILRLHKEGCIHDRVLHDLEQELDLEELGASRFQDES